MSVKRWARGEFGWYELGTTDVAAAKRFYGEVFGWEAADVPMGPGMTYTILRFRGEDLGGAYKLEGPQFEGVPPHWLAYVAVDDVDADTARAVSLGASVLVGPLDVPGVGRISAIRDPQGAVVAMFQAGGHPGTGRFEAAPGSFCWSELVTTDTAAAASFYKAVFGWGIEEMTAGPVRYTEWKVGDRQVGGMMTMPAGVEGVPPHWMNYVAVADCDATVKKAQGLGARLLAPAQDIEGVGRFAVLADPQGAPFAVIRLLF